MYLLFALILYLKTKGINVEWYWYLLAFLEACDSTRKIKIDFPDFKSKIQITRKG